MCAGGGDETGDQGEAARAAGIFFLERNNVHGVGVFLCPLCLLWVRQRNAKPPHQGRFLP